MISRVLALLGVALAVVAFAAAPAPAATSANGGCGLPCGGSTQPAFVAPAHPASNPCIRDAGCGGGAALGSGVAAAAVLLVGAPLVGLVLGVWRRRGVAARLPRGRVSVGGLYRPPRVLFDF